MMMQDETMDSAAEGKGNKARIASCVSDKADGDDDMCLCFTTKKSTS